MEIHEKSIVVNAPVSDVFQMWRNWEDFPKYMSHVKSVKPMDDGLYHWEGSIAGINEVWDAVTTECVPDKAIGWESVSGFRNKGEIKFEGMDGRTKLTVHFEYEPPAGLAGKAVNKIYVGKQFDQSLEHDLENFKSKVEIEQGD